MTSENLKKELNIENLVHIIENSQMATSIESMNLDVYNRVIGELLRNFFPNYVRKEFVLMEYDYESVRFIKKEHESIYENVSCLSFTMLYPSLLVRCVEEGKLNLNIPEFLPLFKFLLDARQVHRNELSQSVNNQIKMLINYTFGAIFSKPKHYSIIRVIHYGYPSGNAITSYLKKEFEAINSHPQLIGYCIDEIYVKGKMPYSIIKMAKSTKLRYYVSIGNLEILRNRKMIYKEKEICV